MACIVWNLWVSRDSHEFLQNQNWAQYGLRYLGSDKDMICLDKLRKAYMLAALNTKEAHSKQSKQKYDVPTYKIGDLVMIRNFDKKSNRDT